MGRLSVQGEFTSTHATPSERSSRRDDPGLLVVAGAGLIGSRLADLARDSGWRIRILHHSAVGQAPREGIEVGVTRRRHAWWAPAERFLPPTALEGARAVVCLSDTLIAPRPWTPVRRREPVASRLSITALIARVTASLSPAGRSEVLLGGSATGFYRDRDDETLTEASGPGEGSLSELCRRWESVADPTAQAGLRMVQSRTSLVVSSSGGLDRILGAVYQVGAGARLGRGDQWQPWIALEDTATGLLWAIEHDDVHGPVSLTAPESAHNRDLHRLLPRADGLLSVAVMPQLLLDWAGRAGAAGGIGNVGGMLAEPLGASQHAVPQALFASGFRFAAPDAASVWTLGA